jgi:hypothetical protein
MGLPIGKIGTRTELMGGSGLLARTRSAFRLGRLPVALFQIRQDDIRNELLLAVFIKLDYRMVLIAGEYGTQTKLSVFYLGSGCIWGLVSGHIVEIASCLILAERNISCMPLRLHLASSRQVGLRGSARFETDDGRGASETT